MSLQKYICAQQTRIPVQISARYANHSAFKFLLLPDLLPTSNYDRQKWN